MSERRLNVYYNQILIGVLIETHGNFLEFKYETNAKYDISLSLKRNEEPYDRKLVKSFLETYYQKVMFLI